MAFLQWVFPILDSIASLIGAQLEAKKGKSNLKIATLNQQIKELGKEKEVQSYPIGFAIDTDEEDEELDDDIL